MISLHVLYLGEGFSALFPSLATAKGFCSTLCISIIWSFTLADLVLGIVTVDSADPGSSCFWCLSRFLQCLILGNCSVAKIAQNVGMPWLAEVFAHERGT